MGRLLVYVSNRDDGLEARLAAEAETLDPPACVEGSAWGLAFYRGDDILHRKHPLVAGTTPHWADLARGVQTDCALLHMRQPSVGDFRAENTHPFRFRRWCFAHQGTAGDSEAARDAIRGALPEFLRRNIRGQTDSETLFHHILAGLHAEGALDAHSVPVQVVLKAIGGSTRAFRHARQANEGEPEAGNEGSGAPSLTFALTDGRTVYALRAGTPLYSVERVEAWPGEKGRRRDVIITTRESAAAGFDEVPEGRVLVVDRDLERRVHEVGP